jgi:hypothetical protein
LIDWLKCLLSKGEAKIRRVTIDSGNGDVGVVMSLLRDFYYFTVLGLLGG